jgi:diguanylate cyclase
LTQVGNRKGFLEDLKGTLEAGQHQQLPLVLMMIDADNFKLLNDEYGHLAGDKVLYFLAQSIKSIIRSGDNVYRYGGEEFAVVLNRCDQEQSFAIADKIRSKIEHSHLIYSGRTIHVTVSVGVTTHQHGDTFEELFSRADEALYSAKKARKNCTIVFGS